MCSCCLRLLQQLQSVLWRPSDSYAGSANLETGVKGLRISIVRFVVFGKDPPLGLVAGGTGGTAA